MRRTVFLLTVVVLAQLGLPSVSHEADWNKVLEESLKVKYELTKTGLDRVRITKPGTVLVIQKENISGDLASDATFLNNKVNNGQIAQAGGFGAFMQDKKTSRVFKAGEKVYVFKLEVKDKAVEFFLVSCETYDVNLHGSTRQTRYKSLVTFEFPEGFLATADADTVKKTVDAVIVPEQEAKTASTLHSADSDFIFAGESGKPPWPDGLLTDHLKPAAVKARIGNIGWHAFRHT